MRLVSRRYFALPTTVPNKSLNFSIEVDRDATAEFASDGAGELEVTLTLRPEPGSFDFAEQSEDGYVIVDGRKATLVLYEGPQPFELLSKLELTLGFIFGERPKLSRVVALTEVVGKDDAEASFIASLHAPRVAGESGRVGLAQVRIPQLDLSSQTVEFLLERHVAVGLHCNASSSSSAASAFREFWRILESGFRAKDKKLVDLLCNYTEARRMEFDRDEIERMRRLRGRASHAESRAGSVEVERVEEECEENIPRLRNLAERIILTKTTWGTPTLEAESVPLRSYVRRDGGIVMSNTGDIQSKE